MVRADKGGGGKGGGGGGGPGGGGGYGPLGRQQHPDARQLQMLRVVYGQALRDQPPPPPPHPTPYSAPRRRKAAAAQFHYQGVPQGLGAMAHHYQGSVKANFF